MCEIVHDKYVHSSCASFVVKMCMYQMSDCRKLQKMILYRCSRDVYFAHTPCLNILVYILRSPCVLKDYTKAPFVRKVLAPCAHSSFVPQDTVPLEFALFTVVPPNVPCSLFMQGFC